MSRHRPKSPAVMRGAKIISRLMRETDILRYENARLRIALRGYDTEPTSPFPLLSSTEILEILGHAAGDRPLAANRPDARPYRVIARVTHRLASQARPAHEIKTAVLAEAARNGLAAEAALRLANNILREKVEGARHG